MTASLEGVNRAVVWATLACLSLAQLHQPAVHHDLFHQMALAREALALGGVPKADLFSYAPTRDAVVDHEWGAGLIGFAAWSLASTTGIAILWFLIAGATVAICARRLQQAELNSGLLLLSGLACVSILGYSLQQPVLAQSYSVVCAAVLLWLVERGTRLHLWLVCPLYIVWVNLHGGNVLAFVITSMLAVERWWRSEPWKHLAVITLVLIALMIATPFGTAYYGYIFRALTMERPEIIEWRPFWLITGWREWLTASYVVSVALFCWAVIKCGFFRGALVVTVLSIITLKTAKITPFYALAWLWYVPCALARSWRIKIPTVLTGAAASATLAMSAVSVSITKPWTVRIPDRHPCIGGVCYPVHAADFLRATAFGGNVMTFFRHGAYLTWTLYPSVRVSIDGRYEVAYPDEHVNRNWQVYRYNPSIIREELRRLSNTHLVLVDQQFPLANEMPKVTGWSAVYSDRTFTLYASPTCRYVPHRLICQHSEGAEHGIPSRTASLR